MEIISVSVYCRRQSEELNEGGLKRGWMFSQQQQRVEAGAEVGCEESNYSIDCGDSSMKKAVIPSSALASLRLGMII